MDEPTLLDPDPALPGRVETTDVVTSGRRPLAATAIALALLAGGLFALSRDDTPATPPTSTVVPSPDATIPATTTTLEPAWYDEIAASLELEPIELPLSAEGTDGWLRLRPRAGLLVQQAGLTDGRPSLLILDDVGRNLTVTLGDDGTWAGAPVEGPDGARVTMLENGLLVAVNRDRAASISFDGMSWIEVKAIDGASWTGSRVGTTAVLGFETLSRRGLFVIDPAADPVVAELDVELPAGRDMRIVHDGGQWLVATPSEDGPRFFRSTDARSFTEVEPFAQAPALGRDGTFSAANPPVLAQGVDLFRLITSGRSIEIANYPGVVLTEAANRSALTALVGVPLDGEARRDDLPDTVTITDINDLGARLEFDLDTSEWRFYTPTATAPSLRFFVTGPSSLQDAGVTLNEQPDGTTQIQVVHLGSGVALFRFSLDEATEALDGLDLFDESATALGEPSLSWTIDDGQTWRHLPLSVFPIDAVLPSVLLGTEHMVLLPNDARRPILFGPRPG